MNAALIGSIWAIGLFPQYAEGKNGDRSCGSGDEQNSCFYGSMEFSAWMR